MTVGGTSFNSFDGTMSGALLPSIELSTTTSSSIYTNPLTPSTNSSNIDNQGGEFGSDIPEIITIAAIVMTGGAGDIVEAGGVAQGYLESVMGVSSAPTAPSTWWGAAATLANGWDDFVGGLTSIGSAIWTGLTSSNDTFGSPGTSDSGGFTVDVSNSTFVNQW
jgi:hypothetical protein